MDINYTRCERAETKRDYTKPEFFYVGVLGGLTAEVGSPLTEDDLQPPDPQ